MMVQNKSSTLLELLFFILCNITYGQVFLHRELEPNRIQNRNITKIHEVFEGSKNEYHTKQSSPATEHVLPIKPVEKHSDVSSYKENNFPSIIFDFNFGDFEDLLHISEKDHLDEDPNQLESEQESSEIGSKNNNFVTTSVTANELKENISNNSSEKVAKSPYVFKILGSPAITNDRDLLTHIWESHKFANDSLLNETITVNSTKNQLPTKIFQIITRLFDHFYWDINHIRRKVTTACGVDMSAYLTALHDNINWAQKAYDTSGHYRGQFFFGNDKWLGLKNFCEELNREVKSEHRSDFEFQFFTGLMSFKLWLPQKKEINLVLGQCLPKTCTTEDIHSVLTLDPHLVTLRSISTSYKNETNVFEVKVLHVRRIPGTYNLWGELKFQIFLTIVIVLIVTIGISSWYQAKLTNTQQRLARSDIKTAELYNLDDKNNDDQIKNIDVEKKSTVMSETEHELQTTAKSFSAQDSSDEFNNNAVNVSHDIEHTQGLKENANYNSHLVQQLGWFEQFLLCFAFQTNAGAILNIDVKKEQRTSCVHGIRVFSLLWTILVHTYLQIFSIGENKYQRVIVERSIWYQSVGNATFSVDTFFFISGFLVTLLFYEQEQDRNKKTKTTKALFSIQSMQRTLFFLFYRYVRLTPAYLFVIIFNDLSLRQMADNSVFLPTIPPNTCRDYWWRNVLYINNFYPLNEICLIWSWYMANDMQFYTMATILLMLSLRHFKLAVLILFFILLSSWGVAGVVSIMYHYKHKVALPFESFDILYDKPWQRVGTYIVGMVTGYIVYRVKLAPKIWARMNVWFWASSLVLMCLLIFGVWNGELDLISTAFYVSIGHTAFGVSLVWIVLSCVWGLAPTVNCILSYRAFWPLSRLTYCTYLIHPLIMLIFSFHMDGTVYLNNAFLLVIFLGNAVVAFVVAFFVSVIFEAPIIRIIKFILK